MKDKNISKLIHSVMENKYTEAKDSIQVIIEKKLQEKIRQELKYLKEKNR